MRFFIFFLMIVSGFLTNWSCKSKTENAGTAKNQAEIPGVPVEVIEKLLNECTFVDYIFHTLPFSLSQEEPPSIKQNILYIDYNKPLKNIPANCKPIARKFFKIGSEFAYDVDVYFSDGCYFYVFVKENKPLYANYMTQDGINFYQKMVDMVKTQTSPKQ